LKEQGPLSFPTCKQALPTTSKLWCKNCRSFIFIFTKIGSKTTIVKFSNSKDNSKHWNQASVSPEVPPEPRIVLLVENWGNPSQNFFREQIPKTAQTAFIPVKWQENNKAEAEADSKPQEAVDKAVEVEEDSMEQVRDLGDLQLTSREN
jgi:hypothetical protein